MSTQIFPTSKQPPSTMLVPQTDPSSRTSPLNPIFMLGGAPKAHDVLSEKFESSFSPSRSFCRCTTFWRGTTVNKSIAAMASDGFEGKRANVFPPQGSSALVSSNEKWFARIKASFHVDQN
jgi:hypothetical protein